MKPIIFDITNNNNNNKTEINVLLRQWLQFVWGKKKLAVDIRQQIKKKREGDKNNGNDIYYKTVYY